MPKLCVIQFLILRDEIAQFGISFFVGNCFVKTSFDERIMSTIIPITMFGIFFEQRSVAVLISNYTFKIDDKS